MEERLGDSYEATGKYLMKAAEKTAPTVSSIGGEWLVLGLARAEYGGTDSMNQKYLQNVKKVLEDNNGVLSTSKYTEYSRVILGLTSIGVDVNNGRGYNLLGPGLISITLFSRVNGPIYALLALDSHGYEIPDVKDVANKTTRDKLIRIYFRSAAERWWMELIRIFYGCGYDSSCNSGSGTILQQQR